MRRLVIAGCAVAGIGLALLAIPPVVDRELNQVVQLDLPPPSEQATRLHAVLNVADMHADPLLWGRDVSQRIDHGHVDMPRLIDGNVALQVFSAPTQVPLGLNYDANELRWDMVTALAVFQRWPMSTWQSATERALYMGQMLRRAAADSQGKLRVIDRRSQLDTFLDERRQRPQITAAVLSIEGMHAIEGKLENLDRLEAGGFRMMGLTHFFDNELGGSAHGMVKGGLTDFGRAVIEKMEAAGILVDLAHASPKLIDDVLAIAKRPVVVSHTGIKGTCDTIRNLSDDHARAIARTGGVIGIGYWDAAICEVTPAGIVKAIRYAVDVVGADYVGLGSDFDGATHTPFDTAGLVRITDGLLASGMSDIEIRKVMGENLLRVLRQTLPE